MKEDFLHYVWKFKRYDANQLRTVLGETIEVLNVGEHNYDSGPDFFNAKIKIGNTIWAGNVELHIKSSSWFKHNHQFDKAYSNVILHVVYNDDRIIFDQNGIPIPTIELKGLIDSNLTTNYDLLLKSKDWIPCGKQIMAVDPFLVDSWLDRLAVERLERKSEEIVHSLVQNKMDWDQTFYHYLFKYFGLKVNAFPFEQLAQKTKLSISEKHNSLMSIEALYFGQAGFLEEKIEDEYYLELQKEYQFLKNKFKLSSLDKECWKLMRLRPANFPAIRIAQLCKLLYENARLFSRMIEAEELDDFYNYFKVEASSYWNNHYQFGIKSKQNRKKELGQSTIDTLLINVVAPFLFVYSKEIQSEKMSNKSLYLLESLKPEKNNIIKKWKELNILSLDAMQSQALLELKDSYCSQKKCLICNIGNQLINK